MSKNIFKKCKKSKELRNFTQTTLHSWPKEVAPWSRMHMDHYWSGTLINTNRLFIRLAQSNP